MSSGADDSSIIVVGRFAGPHGVRGGIHLHSYTSPPANLLAYAPWFVRNPPQDPQWRSLQVVELRPHKDQFVAKIEGVTQREDLHALRGGEVGVLASVLPAPEPNEYYWRDLIGLEVINLQGISLGMVSDMMETGAHDLLVVSKAPKQRLIPFVARYIQAVTLARIEVDWPQDWD